MKLWRIAAETRGYSAADIGGTGAAIHPGRWNDFGQAVVYCASTVSLAVLETAAYIDDGGFPLNRYLIELDVPALVWAAREEFATDDLPVTWAAIPAGNASVRLGSAWLLSKRSPILLVPSVIVPEELTVLINPLHPQSRSITAKTVRRFEYNRVFRPGIS
ncbi:hypothetical protein CR159_19675 [Pollutimonas subterranea]|uniref:RES domain-containing protein n=1 Tax=Pollutimonas subterranea TaxID=2045210 RepID=A0A2N4TZE9_9BURK|nr:RES family NAD+ phosphorylase [Pollutimonas subterranea]PLC48144.1 hypothetical protein CR159_19675 [Pollutimonas subterranea]